MTYTSLQVTYDGTLATVTLHRPEVLHALNAASFDELEHAFRALKEDNRVRVVLLTGSGERAFAAGADIRELLDTDSVTGRQVSERGQQVFNQLDGCGKSVIACIDGVALGGGLELALACTLRIASDRARLGLPEAKLGLVPGYGGTQRLPRLIGRSAALKMMLTAAVIGAEEAFRLGLVDEVVPAADLMNRAREMAAAIAELSPLAVQGILEAVRRGEDLPLRSGLEAEAEIFGALCGTADKHEGLTAFLEKRNPSWRST